jgi:hypothetical protein
MSADTVRSKRAQSFEQVSVLNLWCRTRTDQVVGTGEALHIREDVGDAQTARHDEAGADDQACRRS